MAQQALEHSSRNYFEVSMDKAELERRLAEVQRKIDRQPLFDNQRELVDHFHLGMVGTGGKNAQKLNRRKLEAIDRSIDQAVALRVLYAERDSLQQQIDAFDEKIAQQKIRQAKRE